jgi:hypothetical protein
MNNFKSYLPCGMNGSTRRTLQIASATALVVGFMVSLPLLAFADHLKAPRVPANIQVPAGNKLFLEGHGVGTQNYICLPSGTGFKFTLFTPQAIVFNDDNKEVTTHYFSPNPVEGGTIRATWQYSRDASTVWGLVGPGESSSDPNFVAPDAIAWLLVRVVGAKDGPTRGKTLTETTFIQRLNTSGGVAPSTGCSSSADVGNQAFVPYTADYFFYKKIEVYAVPAG